MSEPSESSAVKMEQAINDRRLIVGFDFGTTFSGVSWMEFNSSIQRLSDAEIQTIRGWPSSHGPDQDESKVPSRLIYNAQGEVTGWGYEVAKGDAIVMEWFKLAIIPDKDLPPHQRNSAKLKATRKQMRELGLTPAQVIAEYIHRIWTHAKGEIKKSVGQRAFKTMRIDVVFTVPAIWNNQQIQAMKNAASTSILQRRAAGKTTCEVLSEPEAAVQAYARQLQNKLGVNESVVVIDNGGGTGDAISYEKVSQGGGLDFAVKEATPGDGDLCGAVFADEAFEKLLLSRLPASHKNLKTNNPGSWGRILAEQWQHSIKRSFEWKGTGQMWPVILSNVTSNVDTVRLHEDEIRDVFESSVMPAIIRLIKKQIEQVKKSHGGKAPLIILPVGGFGRCPYLLQRLREEFEGAAVAGKSSKQGARKKQKLNFQKIEVHSDTGEMPWTSVCRGACIFGMRARLNMGLVKSRSSRTSVCFIENAPGSAEEGGIWVPDFADYMIPNKLTYVVRKGDSIDTSDKAQMAMYFAFDVSAKGMHCERATFYAYDGGSAPDRFDASDTRFRKYGVMEIKVPLPIERLRIEDNESGERRVFDYHLMIETVGGSVNITAVDPATEKKVGELVLADLDTA